MRGWTRKGGAVAVVSWGAALGCANDGNTVQAPPATSEEQVASRAGIVQAGNENGPLVAESTACERFRSALSSSWERLDCDFAVDALLPCPHFIQPLATSSCVTYTESGLDTCVARFESADSCDAVVLGACVLTAVVSELSPGCREADAGGGSAESTAAPDGSVDLDGGAPQESSSPLTHPTSEDTASPQGADGGDPSEPPSTSGAGQTTAIAPDAGDASASDAASEPASSGPASTASGFPLPPEDAG